MGEPRCIVEVDGQIVMPEDINESDVDNTLYMAADTFNVTITNDDLKSDWFRKKQQVKVYYGYVDNPAKWYLSDLTHVHTGMIDGVQPKWGRQNGKIVEIIGRDYSAPMIDTQNSYAFTNWVSSDIANYFAEKYNLKPIITPTSTPVTSDVYQSKQEWEALQTCAAREGFVCYVTKDLELYFGPRQESDDNIVDTLSVIGLGLSTDDMSFDDSGVGVYNKVTVLHYYKKQLIQGSAQNDQLISSMGGQIVEKVMTDSKATTPAIANQLAANFLHEYSRQAITCTFNNLPGNPLYIAEKKIQVVDAGRFSSPYYIEEAKHTYGKQSGYTVSISGTNIRPDDADQYKQDLYNKDKYDVTSGSYVPKGTI
ncbi:phage late control protein D [Desulfosporosinus acididurans]|uniref:Phage late control protein D n=2 Tax=Desulfosporosinus acididurans TaxID=476652 RepID=A0A0J1FS39_9FIRM|nr:phage late control protein D [Desulfosporosinus acididurans]